MAMRIVFDTNYLNCILNNIEETQEILDELVNNKYILTINIATFVELVNQKINNKDKFFDLLDFFIKNNIIICEFENFKCIPYSNFLFEDLKIDNKTKRKELFFPIRNNYYDFVSTLAALFLEWVLDILSKLVTENLQDNQEYKKYLNKIALKYKKEFRKLYEGNKVKLKDKFNDIVYLELKKLSRSGMQINKEIINEIIKAFKNNKKELMKVFNANKRESKKTQKIFLDWYFSTEIHPFINDRFKNVVFEEYIKSILEKIVIGCGKLNGNDISDALILANANSNYIVLTNDDRMCKFLKKKNLYNEEIYQKFNNIFNKKKVEMI